MTVPIKLIYSAVKGEFAEAMAAVANPIAAAATGAVKDTAQEVKLNGRAKIGGAGFSARWQNAFRVNVYPKRGNSIDAAMFAYHKIPYAGIFDTGGTITGSGGGFLWLPLPTAPKRIGGSRITPSLFIQRVGPLHYINNPGKAPMLAAYMTSSAAAASGITIRKLKAGNKRLSQRGILSVVSVPIFYGIRQVEIKAKFRLGSVFSSAQHSLAAYYVQHIKTGAN